MENKKPIVICAIIALIILAIVLFVTFITQLWGFFILLLALFIVLIVALSIYIKEKPDEFSVYQKEKKRILRTYGSVIVEVETLPDIYGKNIIKVKSIDDLVDAQVELREPIYYKNDNDSCFFLLLHYNEACVYILKMNENVISLTEQSIRYMKKEEPGIKIDSILDNIENTLVLKLDELKSVKISPIRNKKKIEVLDNKGIEEKIEEYKDVNEKTLVDELSKTMVIKNLQKQLEDLEEEHNKSKEDDEVHITKIDEEELPQIDEKIIKELDNVPKKDEINIISEEDDLQEKVAQEVKKVKDPKKKANHTRRRVVNYRNKEKK